MPPIRVQTPATGRSLPDPGQGTASNPIATPCPCGCGLPVAVKAGRPCRWASDGCRKRYWLLTHPSIDLAGLTVAQAVAVNRMVEEAVRAARMGQRRATVDSRHPVTHETESIKPDTRPSCRIRLDPEGWADLEALQGILGLPTKTAVVQQLIAQKVAQVVKDVFIEEEGALCP